MTDYAKTERMPQPWFGLSWVGMIGFCLIVWTCFARLIGVV